MINFAIVGCGDISKKHAEAIHNSKDAFFYAACDTDRTKAEQLGEPYGTRVFTDFDEMLLDPHIHVINICTPSSLHAPLAVKAAFAGKHVVVEMPIALTLADADAMIEACRINGVKLAVVHPNRFRPAVIELKAAISERLFGKLSHVNAAMCWNRDQAYNNQADWRITKLMDDDALMHQAIHHLDLLQWLIGPVQQVKAFTTTRIRKIEAGDVAVAVVHFENGVLGVIEAASTKGIDHSEESISVFGETGSAIIEGPAANWIKHWRFEGVSQEESELLIQQVADHPYGVPGHQRIVEDFVGSIQNNRKPIVSGEEGRKALAFVLALYEAMEGQKYLAMERTN